MTNKEFIYCFSLVINVVLLIFAFALKNYEAFFTLTSVALFINIFAYKKLTN